MFNGTKTKESCRICGAESKLLFRKKVLRKYFIKYYRCPLCGLVQTEKPYWLKEAYSLPIANTDTGLLARNSVFSAIVSVIIYYLFDKKKKHLDYAGGYGVLTRLLRDIGFDYHWFDPYTKNMFSVSFEAKKSEKYQIVTAFEFIEHVKDPLREIKQIFKNYKCDALIFSTILYRDPVEEEWWYFAFDSGQHITFYKQKTLREIGKMLNLRFYSNNINFHILSRKKLPLRKFYVAIFFWPILKFWVNIRMRSLTFKDHQNLIDKSS